VIAGAAKDTAAMPSVVTHTAHEARVSIVTGVRSAERLQGFSSVQCYRAPANWPMPVRWLLMWRLHEGVRGLTSARSRAMFQSTDAHSRATSSVPGQLSSPHCEPEDAGSNRPMPESKRKMRVSTTPNSSLVINLKAAKAVGLTCSIAGRPGR
jgi:hypothetical protein